MEPSFIEARIAEADLAARSEPRRGSARSGTIAAGEPFEVFAHVTGPGCDDWGIVARGAYACLDRLVLVDAVPERLPRTGIGELPFVYAHRGEGAPGPIYASLAAWEAGDPPEAWFRAKQSYHFLRVEPTATGPVLVAVDGRVVPVAEAALYAPSAFAGRDLVPDPLPAGATLSWCVEGTGCPTIGGAVLPFHATFPVGDPAAVASVARRTWRPTTRPPEVAADETWIDIDLAEQTLALLTGDSAVFVTLVATGLAGKNQTPRGTYRVQDKLIDNDMVNLPDAEDVYTVERVPWVIHFRPRFAIHGTFWHDRFGFPASHGCVNLSPADARRVFDAIGPVLPPGWRAVYAAPDEPGTVVRVR